MMPTTTSVADGAFLVLNTTSTPNHGPTPSRLNEIGAHRRLLVSPIVSPTSMNSPFRRFANMSPFSLENLLNGEEQIVSYSDTSQYSQGGASACGLAAMNCVRLVLDLEHAGIKENELLRRITQKGFVEEIMSICSYWTNSSHLEIDDIFDTPFFKTFLRLEHSEYGRPEQDKFEEMLHKLGSQSPSSNPYSRRCSALIITRPPEIIVCLRIPHRQSIIYAVFDSHPRPKHPAGAAFIFSTSLAHTASYITSLLHVDARLLDEGAGLQWQAQLLGNVAGHVFVHSGANVQMSEATMSVLIESNMKLLKIKAEAAEVKARCNELGRENERLLKEVSGLGAEKKKFAKEREREREREREQEEKERERARNALRNPLSLLMHSGVHAGARRATVGGGLSSAGPSTVGQPTNRPQNIPTTKAPSLQTGPRPPAPRASTTSGIHSDKQRYTDEALERSLRLAAQMQHEFSIEDSALRNQASQLLSVAGPQATFECALCMDTHIDDCLARVEKCGHAFCRDGLREYIKSRIKSSRYPIMCPVCSASGSIGSSEAGVVTLELIHQIGISEEDYQTYEEMELGAHSVMMHCRKCKRTIYVEKADYQEAKVLFCPLPNCHYVWCKGCQMPLPLNDGGNADQPEHSCDGSSELTHLMTQRGWKHCPGCKTPTEKIDGCNHMTCMSPGCNTHFCYVCGKLMVQSALRKDIKEAVEVHYRVCTLFEEVPDHAVPP